MVEFLHQTHHVAEPVVLVEFKVLLQRTPDVLALA